MCNNTSIYFLVPYVRKQPSYRNCDFKEPQRNWRSVLHILWDNDTRQQHYVSRSIAFHDESREHVKLTPFSRFITAIPGVAFHILSLHKIPHSLFSHPVSLRIISYNCWKHWCDVE